MNFPDVLDHQHNDGEGVKGENEEYVQVGVAGVCLVIVHAASR